MVSTLLALGLISQDLATAPVTLNTGAVALKVTCSVIERQVPGLRINVPKSLESEVVWVRVTNRPANQVIALIAKTMQLDLAWTTLGSVSLRMTEKRKQEIRISEVTERSKRIKASLAAPKNTSGLQPSIAKRLEHPRLALLREAIQKLPSDVIAALEPGERLVFSTTPNGMQNQLKGLDWLLSFPPSWLSEPLEAMDEIITPTANPRMRQLSWNVGDPSVGLGKALVVVQRRSVDEALSVQLLLLDRNGGNLGSASEQIYFRPKSIKAGPALIQPDFSQETKLWADALRSNNSETLFASLGGDAGLSVTVETSCMQGAVAAVQGQTRAILRDPVNHEPLELTVRVLDQMKPKGEVVAWLPDDALAGSVGVVNEKRPVESGWDTPSLIPFGMRSKQEFGVTLMLPLRPWTALSQRVNRAALSKLFKSIDRTRVPTIDSMLEFVSASNKAPGSNELDGLYLQATGRGGVRELLSGETGSIPVLRFLSGLSPAQRSLLSGGGVLDTNLLVTTQTIALGKDVFQADEGPYLLRPNKPNSGQAASMTMSGTNGNTGRTEETTIRLVRNDDERTELLSGGLSAARTVAATVSAEESVLRFQVEGFDEAILQPFDLARRAVMVEGKPTFPGKYLPVVSTTVVLTYQLSPKVQMRREFKHYAIPPNTRPMPYAELSPQFRAKVQTHIERQVEVVLSTQSTQ